MCRICGRMVKCFFENMPSKVHHVPSRRAFTTVRRISPAVSRLSSAVTNTSPTLGLTRAFSAMSVRPKTTSALSGTSTRPSLAIQEQKPLSIAIQSRAFSASATLGAKRDTYDPSRRVQKRRHGFLARVKSKGGREVLKRRRLKGRTSLSW